MGLFGGTKTEPKTADKPRRARRLVASGLRIETGAFSSDVVRALALTKQPWQSDAWGYRDKIGELRFGLQFRSRAVARVKYLPAQVMANEDEPIPLDSDKGITIPAALAAAAAFELARLPLDAGYQFLGVLDENMGVTGECWLHGVKSGGMEQWEILSVDEVDAGGDGQMYIRDLGSSGGRRLVTAQEEMLRLWVPHPRFKILADSPMRSLLEPCEDIVLAGREMRAAARSRFAANGLLLIPNGLTLMNAVKEDTDEIDDDAMFAELGAMLLAPISNEGDPGAVIPAMLKGETEDLAAVRHLTMTREDSPTLLEKIDKSLGRLARGLDIPPEIITGMAAANHWTAWQIDASTYRNHIDPAVRIIADSLTEAFLRPALLARGFSPEDVALVQVWYDAGAVTENPNRVQDAKDAFDRGGIGWEPLRQALGFNAADAPSDEETLRMVAFKIGSDPATAAVLLQTLFGKGDPIEAVNKRIVDPTGTENVPDDPTETKALPPGQPGQAPALPAAPTPSTPAPSLAAQSILALISGATPVTADTQDDGDWLLLDASKLMEIDRADRDRIVTAADAAVSRALEKAGAKIRSKAQKNAAHRQIAASADVSQLASILGRDVVTAMFADADIFGDSLDDLEAKFGRWVAASIQRTITAVLALLRVDKDSDRGKAITEKLTTAMSGRVKGGWSLLRAGLAKLAEQYLYNPHPAEEPGEASDSLVPAGLVRGALAFVGGAPADTGGITDEGEPVRPVRPLGGVALGDEVETVLADEGAHQLGFQWVYGITPATRHFEPHLALEGERFTSWSDPRLVPEDRYAWVGPHFTPGDHKGCMCDYVPSYAIREYAETVADRVGPESPAMADIRDLAEGDDRAGRKGTTAQATRDERDRILKLQDRFIKGGKS